MFYVQDRICQSCHTAAFLQYVQYRSIRHAFKGKVDFFVVARSNSNLKAASFECLATFGKEQHGCPHELSHPCSENTGEPT